MKIANVLTDGPLARQYARQQVAPYDRKIRWSSFRRGRYSPQALAYAAHTARTLAAGEYGAVVLFASLASSLALHGAPFDLVSAAAKIPTEEMRHADAFTRFAARCLDRPVEDVTLEVDGDALRKRFSPPSSHADLDAFMIKLSAVDESLAAALLDGCVASAKDPVARGLFATVLRDEVHHARLGWYYLAWRAPRWSFEERQQAADRTGLLVMDIARRHRAKRPAPTRVEVEARSLGIIDFRERSRIVREVMEREILPALDSHGLGASLAYEAGMKLQPGGEEPAPADVAPVLDGLGSATSRVRRTARA